MPQPFKNLSKETHTVSTLNIKAQSATHAVMELYGTVGGDWFDEGITAKDVVKKLNELPSTIKTLDLRINSPGGSVFDGIAIMNRVKEYGKKVKVTAYIDSLAASIASIIMLGAEEIVMSEGSFVMIHKPSTGLYGNSDDFQKIQDVLDNIENEMIGIYMRKTKMSRVEIKEMLAKETWMSSSEALELGFVDRVLEQEYEVAACLNSHLPWMAKAPKALPTQATLAKKKATELENKINKFLARK